MSMRCSNNDCYTPYHDVKKYNSKLIGDDGYLYCHDCSIKKNKDEETFITMSMNTYDYYLKNKDKYKDDDKPLRLDSIVKYKYLHQYIKNQIPIHEETIFKDNKEYILIDKSDYYELEVLLWKKNITFEKLLEQRNDKIVKQKSGMNEDEKEELLMRKEERKKEVKEKVNDDKIKRQKRELEISKELKQEKIDYYKKEKIPDGYKERIIKRCDYCRNSVCKGIRVFPDEYMISEKDPDRRKSFKGIICDYCVESKEYDKLEKIEKCDCGGVYINSPSHMRNHFNTKKHDDWVKFCRLSNGKEKAYYSYKLIDLRKLCSKNNQALGKTIIDNYYTMKKEELVKELVRIDKEGQLLITEL